MEPWEVYDANEVHSSPSGSRKWSKLPPATNSHGNDSTTGSSHSIEETKKDGADHQDEGISVAMAQAWTVGYLVTNAEDLQGEAKAKLE